MRWCRLNSGFPPATPSRSPASLQRTVPRLQGTLSRVLRLIGFAARGSVSALSAPAAVQARRGPGSGFFLRQPLSSGLPAARAGSPRFPGDPVTLRRSTTPDDPLRLASNGASGAAPTRLTMKASSLHRFRGFLRRFITCCLRFTTGVTARHARLASGWRAAPLPGGSRTRWIATRGFSSWHPPLQGLAWRNKRSVRPWGSLI